MNYGVLEDNMYQNYSLFYSYSKAGDVLIISLCDGESVRTETRSNIELSYDETDYLLKIKIHGISKIMKIHSNGLIPLPANQFIDVINTLLAKENIDKLAYKYKSDFIIGEVTEHGVNIGEKTIELKVDGLNIKDKVVVCYPWVRLATGKWANKYWVCTYKDLSISESDEIFIIDEDDVVIGEDFYKIREGK